VNEFFTFLSFFLIKKLFTCCVTDEVSKKASIEASKVLAYIYVEIAQLVSCFVAYSKIRMILNHFNSKATFSKIRLG
jgi:hypothetical protein